MQKIIDFVEMCAIDKSLYWRIKNEDESVTFEIQWNHNHKSPWRYRKLNDLFWNIAESKHILHALKNASVDMESFERKLRHSLLQQIAYADKIVQDAKNIFGTETVEDAIDDNNRFMRQLEEAIRNLSDDSSSPAFTNPKKQRPRLELIKSR